MTDSTRVPLRHPSRRRPVPSSRPRPSARSVRARSASTHRARTRARRALTRARAHHHHRAPNNITPPSRSGPGGGTVLESPSVGREITRASRAPRAPSPIDRSVSIDRLDRSSRSVISIGHLDRSIGHLDRSIGHLDRSIDHLDRSSRSVSIGLGALDRAVGRSSDAREDAGPDARWRRARARWWWDRRDVGGCDR